MSTKAGNYVPSIAPRTPPPNISLHAEGRNAVPCSLIIIICMFIITPSLTPIPTRHINKMDFSSNAPQQKGFFNKKLLPAVKRIFPVAERVLPAVATFVPALAPAAAVVGAIGSLRR